jgi:flap endonuclease-1
MGIRLLNKLINTYSQEAIKQTHLTEFYNKTLCIDTMIYLYKYKTEDALLENMYLMCTILHHYKIKPIFVFDGSPPKEKYNEIKKRQEKRKEALEKFNNMTEEDKKGMTQKNLHDLKRQIVKITKEDIENVKNLFNYYGIEHITSNGEADSLLAELVIKKKAHACISDDMDLFAYGCPIVLRHFSLFKHNVLAYNTKLIYKKLKINSIDFKWLCVTSGTDYYKNRNNKNIFFYYNIYTKYLRLNTDITFPDWLLNKNILFKKDHELIKDTIELFNIKNEINTKNIFKWKRMDKNKLYILLEKENFLNPIVN